MGKTVSFFRRGLALTFGLASLWGCQPTPDYRITVRDIPPGAQALLIGWKSDGDTVGKSSLVVPITQLGPDDRGSYVIGFDLAGEPDESGIVSVATVDKNLCITSVVSAPSAPRSSTSVSQLDIELDPNLNPEIVQRASAQDPPIDCPSDTPQLPFPPHKPCAKVPGLSSIPSEPTQIPTRPVVINVLRQLRGQARVFEGGKLSFYGWGFNRPGLTFGVACDPTNCFFDLAQQYMMYQALLVTPTSFRYPELNLVSYSQLDLPVSVVKEAFMVAPRSLQEGVVLCLTVSAGSYYLKNLDGQETSFSEALP